VKAAWSLSLVGALALLVGCGVGQGSGSALGPMTMDDCGGPGRVFPPPDAPQDYNLAPRFFAAEQLLDLSGGRGKSNRLIIRLQANGRQREANDVLEFDIPNVYEVGRCLLGDIDSGAATKLDPGNCAGGRIRVGTGALIHAYLVPNLKCSTKMQMYDHVGTAISTMQPNGGAWESFIDFEFFGGLRNKPLQPDFKIDIDDRLKASFTLQLEDDAVISAQLDPLMPVVPTSHIHGNMKGDFDFLMQRGQGAQTFP
jgi:hypothetical protein